MSRHGIKAAFAQQQTGLTCRDVRLKYLEGGKRSEYTFDIVGREPVVIIWDQSGNDSAIAARAIEKINDT